MWLLKVDFFFKISKNEHLHVKNITSRELLELQHNFVEILSIKATQVIKFKRWHAYPQKMWSLKVDFLYKTSKNEYLNGENICAAELLKNFPLITGMDSTQIRKIQQVPRPPPETLIAQTQLFVKYLRKWIFKWQKCSSRKIFGALNQLSPNFGSARDSNKQNSGSVIPNLWEFDCSKSIVCKKLAKMNIFGKNNLFSKTFVVLKQLSFNTHNGNNSNE